MPITRRKCCANSLLTETSLNFDQDAMLRFSLDQLSVFMGSVIHSHQCDQQITKYNNLLAMAATKVCNYAGHSRFTNRGLGKHCVTLSGRDEPLDVLPLFRIFKKVLANFSGGYFSRE